MAITQTTKKLGFGLMRLPRTNEQIDLEQVKAMVDRFMQAGFTYFDTAWAYPGSEEAIRAALVERYPRDSFLLATKNAAWLKTTTREDAIAQFDTSLAQTGAGYFDFYLLHNLGAHRTAYFERFDMWNFVQEQKACGKIRHAGFSFHGKPEELEEILQAHPEAEFVQLQINYADWEAPSVQSRACYEVARRHGKPIIIMEPVKGGILANPPQSVRDILHAANPTASMASWAVRFAASLEGVYTVLSGMSNLEQMEDNLSYMQDFAPLSAAEQHAVQQAQQTLAAIPLIPCTSCNYCAKVCPQNVGISGTFNAANEFIMYENKQNALGREHWFVTAHHKEKAENCIRCGACVQVCPQHIDIPEELTKALAMLR